MNNYNKLNIYSFLKTLTMIAATSSLTSFTAFAANPTEVGRNSAVKGDVRIKSAEDERIRQAIIKEPVFLGDNVNSSVGSSLQVLLKDNSTFTVGPQCDIVIDEFVYDPKKNNNTLSAKVKKGMFRFTSGNVSKSNPDQVNVTTPTATMGIRGTMIEVLVGPEAFLCAEKEGLLAGDIRMDHAGATLVILRGPGPQNASANRRGEVEITSGNQTIRLSEPGTGVLVSNAEQKPSEPFVVSDSLYNYFSRRLRTMPTKSGNFRPFEINDAMFTPIPVEDELEFLIPMEKVEDTEWPTQFIDDLEGGDGVFE